MHELVQEVEPSVFSHLRIALSAEERVELDGRAICLSPRNREGRSELLALHVVEFLVDLLVLEHFFSEASLLLALVLALAVLVALQKLLDWFRVGIELDSIYLAEVVFVSDDLLQNRALQRKGPGLELLLEKLVQILLHRRSHPVDLLP